MNKSKFLKKSLAVLLSVMMVVAMIPLGASAAWTVSNTDDVVEVTATAPVTIEKTGTTAGTLTLPWDQSSPARITVLFQNAVTDVTVKFDDKDADAAAVTKTSLSTAHTVDIDVPATAKTVTFVPVKGANSGATYTITVNKPAASDDVSLASAAIGTGDNAITGVISGRTITFTVPWGMTVATGDFHIKAKAPATAGDLTVTGTGAANDPFTTTVTSQTGNYSTKYVIVLNEEKALTSLKVGGVDATWVEADPTATPAVTAHYEVNLPTGTDLSKKQVIAYTGNDIAKFELSGNTDAVVSGKEATVTAGDSTITLTSKKGSPAYTKTYTLKVAITKNDKTDIESFTLSDGTYTAQGKVSGESLIAELPYSAILDATAPHAGITAEITASAGATVTAASGSVTGPTNGKYTISGLDLSDGKTVRITVTAEDGKKTFYYSLSATKADNRNNSNDVDSLKMTIGTGDDLKEYQGAKSGTTFTFTVPYATDAAKIADPNTKFIGAYPSGSSLTDAADASITNPSGSGYTDNDLKTAITFKVTSETGRVATYTIKFAKQAAETGKTLSGVSFANAATASAVKAENTYAATVSGKKLTVTFPYSAEANPGDYTNLVPQFTLSKGAKLYGDDGNEVKSGYFTKEDAEADKTGATTEGNSKTPVIKLADLRNEYVFTVADETAVFEHETKGTSWNDIKDEEGDLKGHVTEITVEVKYAAAQTGASLTGITDETGKVTGAMSGSTLTITVPGSYVDDASKEIALTWNASPMAVVKAGSTNLNDAATKLLVTSSTVDGKTVYAVSVKGGTAFDKVTVTNEADTNTRTYNVEVKANPIQTGALITAAKANDTTATVNNRDWTITATVPATTDLEKVKLTLTGSTMADVKVVQAASDSDAPLAKDDKNADIADTYNLSDLEHPLRVKVVAEDGATKNYYTLVIKTEEIAFSDVKSGDWFYDDVIAAATAGIVSGYPDKTYKPNNNIKRKDFAVMVASMMGADLTKYTTSAFSDVAHDYAEKAIAYCGETGIIAGKAAGKFAPNDFITREQAATIVARALKLQSTSANKFADDASISSWATNGVYACVASGIIEGVGNNTFAPKKNLTRAQAARILVLALNQK